MTWGEWKHSFIAVGVQTYTATMEISVAEFLSKMEIDLLQDLAVSLFHINPKEVLFYHRDTCSTMFIVTVFIIVRN